MTNATHLAASADDMPSDRTRAAMVSKRCMLNYLLALRCSSMGLKDIVRPKLQQVLDLAQRQRILDIHHHRQANYFG